jgi:tetratricopeptide (TPR) repeat protein
MPKRPKLLIILLFLWSIPLAASKDSLLSVIKGKFPVREQMKAMASLGFIYHVSNPDSAIYYAQKCIQLNGELNESAERASCFNALGLGYHRKGFYKQALNAFYEAIRFYENAGEQEQVARVNINISQVCSIQKDFFNAQQYAMKSLRFYEETNDSLRLAASYQTVAMICREIKDFDIAMDYINHSANIFKRLNRNGDWANSIGIRGNIYRVQQRYEEAIKDYEMAIFTYDQVGDLSGAAIAFENLGETYLTLKKFQKALEKFQQALALFERLGSETDVAYENLKLSSALKGLKRFDEALKALQFSTAYFKNNGLVHYLLEAYELYYQTYKAMGLKTEALSFHEKYILLKDSLSDVQSKEEIMRIQMAYEAEKKEGEIALLQAQ